MSGRRLVKDEDERARGAGCALLHRAAEAVAVRVQLNKVMAAATTNGEPGMPTILRGDLNELANRVLASLNELLATTKQGLQRIRRRPRLLLAFLDRCGLALPPA